MVDVDRLLRERSDQTLGVIGALSLGFAGGLLVSGSNRLLIGAALTPAVLVAAAAWDRLVRDTRPSRGAPADRTPHRLRSLRLEPTPEHSATPGLLARASRSLVPETGDRARQAGLTSPTARDPALTMGGRSSRPGASNAGSAGSSVGSGHIRAGHLDPGCPGARPWVRAPPCRAPPSPDQAARCPARSSRVRAARSCLRPRHGPAPAGAGWPRSSARRGHRWGGGGRSRTKTGPASMPVDPCLSLLSDGCSAGCADRQRVGGRVAGRPQRDPMGMHQLLSGASGPPATARELSPRGSGAVRSREARSESPGAQK